MLLKVKDKKDFGYFISIIFEKPKGFSFYAGQYLDYELNGDTRAFTISASPSEEFLMLTTKKGQSEFKKALAKIKTGDEIKSSHPAGTFTLDKSSPAVFIARGVGITPFRSMIKDAYDQKLKTPITLIYSSSDENLLFRNELDKWKEELNMNIIYHNTIQHGHLTHLLPTTYYLPIYYLAGSHSFVNDMEKILKDLEVDETNIRYDKFDGYD